MPDQGVLFLGGAETVLGVSDEFKPIPGQRGVYMIDR
jgi:chemotaxis protein methyltransferase CheR